MNVSQSKYHITRIDKNRQQHDFRKDFSTIQLFRKNKIKVISNAVARFPRHHCPLPIAYFLVQSRAFFSASASFS